MGHATAWKLRARRKHCVLAHRRRARRRRHVPVFGVATLYLLLSVVPMVVACTSLPSAPAVLATAPADMLAAVFALAAAPAVFFRSAVLVLTGIAGVLGGGGTSIFGELVAMMALLPDLLDGLVAWLNAPHSPVTPGGGPGYKKGGQLLCRRLRRRNACCSRPLCHESHDAAHGTFPPPRRSAGESEPAAAASASESGASAGPRYGHHPSSSSASRRHHRAARPAVLAVGVLLISSLVFAPLVSAQAPVDARTLVAAASGTAVGMVGAAVASATSSVSMEADAGAASGAGAVLATVAAVVATATAVGVAAAAASTDLGHHVKRRRGDVDVAPGDDSSDPVPADTETSVAHMGDRSQLLSSSSPDADPRLLDTLDRLGLLLNQKYCCLICKHCGITVGGSAKPVAAHLKGHHRPLLSAMTAEDTETLNRIAGPPLNVLPTADALRLTRGCEAVQGLLVHTKTACSLCGAAIDAHRQKAHMRTHGAKDATFPPTYLQQPVPNVALCAVTLPTPLERGVTPAVADASARDGNEGAAAAGAGARDGNGAAAAAAAGARDGNEGAAAAAGARDGNEGAAAGAAGARDGNGAAAAAAGARDGNGAAAAAAAGAGDGNGAAAAAGARDGNGAAAAAGARVGSGAAAAAGAARDGSGAAAAAGAARGGNEGAAAAAGARVGSGAAAADASVAPSPADARWEAFDALFSGEQFLPKADGADSAADDEHGTSFFLTRIGWARPMDARIAAAATALGAPASSEEEKRVATAVTAWVQWACSGVQTIDSQGRRLLNRIASYAEADDDATRTFNALETGSRKTYALTLTAFLLFLLRAGRDASLRAVPALGSAPALEAPEPVRIAVEDLAQRPSATAVGAAVAAIFGSSELTGRTVGGPDGGTARRHLRIPAERQLVEVFLRVRATTSGRGGGSERPELPKPDDVGHAAVHLIFVARLAVAARVLENPTMEEAEFGALLDTVSFPNTPSPFDAAVAARQIARAAAARADARARLSYVLASGYRAVRIVGVDGQVSLDNLGLMCTKLQDWIRAALLELTAGAALLRLDDLGDADARERLEFTETTAGRTVIPDKSEPVRRALLNSARWRTLVTAGAEPALDTRIANAYLSLASDVVTKLLVLIHICGGQPARGTELAALLYANTESAERNLHFAHGSILLLQRYSKTRTVSGHDAFVVRCLDPTTADLLLAYLAQVRPIERALVGAVASNAEEAEAARLACASVLFCRRGVPMSGEAVGTAFAATTASKEHGLGFALGLLEFRHAAIALARVLIKFSPALLRLIEAVDSQAAHSLAVAMDLYGRAVGQHGRLEAELLHLIVSLAWHGLLGLPVVEHALDLPDARPLAALRGDGSAGASASASAASAASATRLTAAAAAIVNNPVRLCAGLGGDAMRDRMFVRDRLMDLTLNAVGKALIATVYVFAPSVLLLGGSFFFPPLSPPLSSEENAS